jgi:hypothetical protein
MDRRMSVKKGPHDDCSIYGCSRRPRFVFTNETTIRLNENWCACPDHRARIRSFILERDMAWGLPDLPVNEQRVAEL